MGAAYTSCTRRAGGGVACPGVATELSPHGAAEDRWQGAEGPAYWRNAGAKSALLSSHVTKQGGCFLDLVSISSDSLLLGSHEVITKGVGCNADLERDTPRSCSKEIIKR